MLQNLGFQQLMQIRNDLASHIPGDPSWHASAGAMLRAMADDLLGQHPDNPANIPLTASEQRRLDELRDLQARHAQERADEAEAIKQVEGQPAAAA